MPHERRGAADAIGTPRLRQDPPDRPEVRPVRLGRVNPKIRNRVMAGVLVLMFVVVAVAAAVGK